MVKRLVVLIGEDDHRLVRVVAARAGVSASRWAAGVLTREAVKAEAAVPPAAAPDRITGLIAEAQARHRPSKVVSAPRASDEALAKECPTHAIPLVQTEVGWACPVCQASSP